MRNNIFEDTDFGDRYLTADGEEVIFLSEKDGIYYCGVKGFQESIPYDVTGKCLLTEIVGIDVSDGHLDVDQRITFTTELIDTMTVGELKELLNDQTFPINPEARIIVNHHFAPTCCSFDANEDYFFIGASRLSPNPYLEEQLEKYGKGFRR